MSLKILKSGFFSLLQDQRRLGYHNIGLGFSGALDEVSYLLGQYLLCHKNPTNSIEILLGGFKAEVLKSANFSITGANAQITKNEQEIPPFSRFFVKKGDIIKIENIQKGNLNYLAVEGGFQLEKFCNSFATNFHLKIGPNQGKKIQNQQILKYKTVKKKPFGVIPLKNLPESWQKITSHSKRSPIKLDLVLFPNVRDFFHQEDLANFFQSPYEISTDINRAGIRLLGKKIIPKKQLLLSEGLCFSTIQIQNSGVPIILMKDCQTIGGYPKIGYINAIDCFSLAQLGPKSKILFQPVSAEASQKKSNQFYQTFLPNFFLKAK